MAMHSRVVLVGLMIGCLAACGERSTPVEESFPGDAREAGAKIDGLRDDVEAVLDSTVAALHEELRVAREIYDRDMANKEAIIEELRGEVAGRQAGLITAVEREFQSLAEYLGRVKEVPLKEWLARIGSDDEAMRSLALDALVGWHLEADGVLERLLRPPAGSESPGREEVIWRLGLIWRHPKPLELVRTSEDEDVVLAALDIIAADGYRARTLVPDLEELAAKEGHSPEVVSRIRTTIGKISSR